MATSLYHRQQQPQQQSSTIQMEHHQQQQSQQQRRAHKRGPWSQAEDSYLMHLVNQTHPHNWVKIAETLGSRSAKQCRERYHQNLKPTLNHDPISETEGKMIETMVVNMGKRWADIARKLNGRSDNQVKNWWNGSMNRRKRLEAKRAQQHVDLPLAPPVTLDQQRRLPPLPSAYCPTPHRHHAVIPVTQAPQVPRPGSLLPSIKTTLASTPRFVHSSYGMESPLPSPSSLAPSPGAESLSLPQSPTYTTTSPTCARDPRPRLPPPQYLLNETRPMAPHQMQSQIPPQSSAYGERTENVHLPPIISPVSTAPSSPTLALGAHNARSQADKRLSVRSLLS